MRDDPKSPEQPDPPAKPDPEPDLLEHPVLPRLGLSATTIVAIFVGGALGTLARFLLDEGHPTAAGHFPLTTLLINLSGSLVIGAGIPLTERVGQRLPALRPFAIVGVLGGWTTYSTLANDGIQLAQHGHVLIMLAYLGATVFGGIGAVLVGHRFTAGLQHGETAA
jgi:fluoride exporter